MLAHILSIWVFLFGYSSPAPMVQHDEDSRYHQRTEIVYPVDIGCVGAACPMPWTGPT